MYLIFDTETTGKPKDYKAAMTNLDNWPRIIQLGWALHKEDGELIASRTDLIKPDGWVIPVEKFWIDNGYSTVKNESNGIPIAVALNHFVSAAKDCMAMVAHNMAFDYNVLGAEMIRANVTTGRKIMTICTMEDGTNLCKLPNRTGRPGKYKWPSLAELHLKLFGCGFDGAHDAGADVKACAKCFFAMKELT